MKLAASTINTSDIFGTVAPPPGSSFATGPNALGILLGNAIMIFVIIAALVALIYLLWGGLDWITSGGEKEKLVKARQKIRNALVGLIVIFGALIIFNVVINTILGGKILQKTDTGFQFTLPSF